MKKQNKILVYYREDNKRAKFWEKKIINHLRKSRIAFEISKDKPSLVIILGGDGTILEAVRKFTGINPLFLGLNLGHVGFLASTRDENEFIKSINNFFTGDYSVTERMLLEAKIKRNKKEIGSFLALNDVSVQNLLGMVKLRISIDGHSLHQIHGTGTLISTATGSTAYNLSAHGPIMMPDIPCFIITELLDHNIPTPPIVVNHNREIEILVQSFRERKLFTIENSRTNADVVLSSDGESIVALQERDIVNIKKAPESAKFVEFESNYFFKSLGEKFSFK